MKLPILLIFTVPLILVSIWFKDGYLLGAAEAELPFYNLQRFADRTAWAWTDFQLGYVSSFTVASYPTWSFLAYIQNLGVSGFLIQAGVFYILFLVAGVGIYLLTKELFPNINRFANLCTVFFYWFNPLSLVNVWNRFLYNFMFFFALLPITLYFFIKGLQKKKYIYVFLVNASILLFSFSLTSYVHNFLIWFLFAYTSLFYSLNAQSKDEIGFYIKFFSLTLIIYIVFNMWWILPTFNLFVSTPSREAITSNVFTSELNLQTLKVLSEKLGNLVDLTRLMHFAFYAGEGPLWSSIYTIWPFILSFFTTTAILFWVLFQCRKEKNILYLGILFILSIFLAKGSNPPFGEVFKFLFEKFVFLQTFRNPFEKFGFLIALMSAPLFGYGIYKLESWLKSKQLKSVLYLGSLLGLILLFGYPFINGWVFTSITYPNNDYSVGYKVAVPKYYKDADDWLSSSGKNFRFIGFPLGGEGITYNWEKGYQGVELSNTLFATPNVLFNTTGWPHYFPLVERLEPLFFKRDNFSKISNILNAKYIMVRSDIDYGFRGMRDPKSIYERLKQLASKDEIKKIAEFGAISFWENTKWEDRTIYGENLLVKASPSSLVDDLLLEEVKNEKALLETDIDLGVNLDTLIFRPTEGKFNSNINIVEYSFNLPQDGNYDLIVENNEYANTENLEVFIDENSINFQSILRGDNKLYLGKYYIDKGTHSLKFRLPKVANLIKPPDIFTLNKYNNSLILKVDPYDPYAKYFARFEVVIKSGSGFSYGLYGGNNSLGERTTLYSQFIAFEKEINEFRNVSISFPIISTSEELNFFLKIDDPNAEVPLRNLTFGAIADLFPLLILKNAESESYPKTDISYFKHNPTKYRVKITDSKHPFALIFSDLYNPSWQAKYEDGRIIEKHFMANGYANGWLIEAEGDTNITIEFASQHLLEKGNVISKASYAGVLIYLGILFIKRRKRLWK